MQKLQTGLLDRVLRFDGVSIVTEEQAEALLLRGVPPSSLRAVESSPEIDHYNLQVEEANRIEVNADSPVSISLEWLLDEKYLTLNLRERVQAALEAKLHDPKYSMQDALDAEQRVQDELDEIEQRGMVEFFRTICCILDTFREKNIVWGVGRGSSCASYILYLLGLHVVDCVKFDVPMEEFFHD